MRSQRRVGIIAYDCVQALDIVGPADAFAAATTVENNRKVPAYQISLIGLDSKPVTSESGIVFQPDSSIRSSPRLDTVIVPGGRALRLNLQTRQKVAKWVGEHATAIRRIASVCTGVYGIAPTGLLDGRSVTTHWLFADDFSSQFPKINVEANALFLKDGPFYSSAGITAGIDLSLALIEEDYGSRVALEVARELVVYLKRSGGQEQYSAPLQFQSQAQDRFKDVASWILGNLEKDLAVERLAEKVNLCPRHFSRVFRDAFGSSPGEFVEKLRLAEARRLLHERRAKVADVAEAVGFASADSFRRAFERRLGISPSQYRSHFQGKAILGVKR
jgi:transcriptional regulator GlxA family with amidase domain